MIDGDASHRSHRVWLHLLHQNREALINHIFLPAVTDADVITALVDLNDRRRSE
jgi:hypothetical protein